MKNSRISLKWMTAVLAVVFLSGCASVRTASTLKPSGDTHLTLGHARFSIMSYADVYDKDTPGVENWKHLTAEEVSKRAMELYPELFTDEWTGLPVMVKADVKYDMCSLKTSGIITGLTLGLIPYPGKTTLSYSVRTDVRDALGESMSARSVDFVIEQATWVSLVGPLGCLPVPGEADLPRDTVFLFIPLSGDPYATQGKMEHYITDCMIEAIVRNLRSIDTAALDAASKARSSHLQEVTVEGRTFWSFLAPMISKEDGRPVSFTAMLYQDKPKRGTAPYEQVVVARRDGGAWTPVSGYLRRTRSLTAVKALMENGAPARVVVQQVAEPPLADFIDTPALTADDLRWSNGILLEAKNRSLGKMVHEESRNTLLGLATRIEKSILELNEQAEKAKDRAQAKVEKGEGDPAADRELSVLCRQRIEVLKPILAAIKQGAAAKKPD